MRGTLIHAPGDVRIETRDDTKIVNPTDAIIRVTTS
jgi:threonine dehydrogenase-like Zn-dependent dehydrogenase